MGTFLSIILDILAILAIIVFGSFIIVVIADLILCLFDDHEGIIFRRNRDENKNQEKKDDEVKRDDDIVVYSSMPDDSRRLDKDSEKSKTPEVIDGDSVTGIDEDQALAEQQALMSKKAPAPKPQPKPEPKKVEPQNDEFWDVEDDKEFTSLLDEVIKEAKEDDKKQKEKQEEKKAKEEQEKKPEEVKEDKKEEKKEDPKVDEQTLKALEELKALKEQQQQEIEEFKKIKEDFAREKEEELALLKENWSKAKAEEIERIRQEAMLEQEKLDAERARLEQEKLDAEKEKLALQEELKNRDEREKDIKEPEPIIKETIIKDEEEINKLKYKNIVRMNARLSRIIRDTEKLQDQKLKEQEKAMVERQRMLEIEQQEKAKEQERRVEIQRKNREKLEQLRQKEIEKKLNDTSKKESKYKLNNKVVTVVKEELTMPISDDDDDAIREVVIPADNEYATMNSKALRMSEKPLFDRAYYEQKLEELEEELKEAEKELKLNKNEYIPLTRIYKAYDRDSEKLRKREIQVAKQKVALYGVNSNKIDDAKKAKLNENVQSLIELKDSVAHCEDVIRKNKDRYPVLQKNYTLLTKQITRINDDVRVCEKAIDYYNKKSN